jgi:predicted lipid-binding transport protein (Tim44 family)
MSMANADDRMGGGVLGGIGALLGRLLLMVAGAVFFVSALVAAVIASVVVLVWSLLTGRRPALVHFADGRWRFRVRRSAPPAAAPAPRAPGSGDVIDIEAREIPDEPRRD